MLKDKPYDIIKPAFEQHLRDSPNMPTPHDILNNIANIELKEDADNAPQIELDPYRGMGKAMWERLQELRERDSKIV